MNDAIVAWYGLAFLMAEDYPEEAASAFKQGGGYRPGQGSNFYLPFCWARSNILSRSSLSLGHL